MYTFVFIHSLEVIRWLLNALYCMSKFLFLYFYTQFSFSMKIPIHPPNDGSVFKNLTKFSPLDMDIKKVPHMYGCRDNIHSLLLI